VLEEQSEEVKHRFKGVYNGLARLKSYLVDHLRYSEPAIFYHDPSVDAWLALNTDDELQHAHEAATRLSTSACCIRIRVAVALSGVAVLHCHDDTHSLAIEGLKFEVWAADRTRRIHPPFSIGSCSVRALERRLTCQDLGYSKPTMRYLHGPNGKEHALGTDQELIQACEDGSPSGIVRLIVTNASLTESFGICVVSAQESEAGRREPQVICDAMRNLGYSIKTPPNDPSNWLCQDMLGPDATPRMRILHFALHGSEHLGMKTLGSGRGSAALTPTSFIEDLDTFHADLDCVILSMCNSAAYAEAIMRAQVRRVKHVIHWSLPAVSSELSRVFAGAFYTQLRRYDKVHDFQAAFDSAKRAVERNVDASTHSLLHLTWGVPVWADPIAEELDMTANEEMNWRAVDALPIDDHGAATEWPGRQAATIKPYRGYATLAGHHEKECLRALAGLRGVTDYVAINGIDIRVGNGCGIKGMHEPLSLIKLYGISDTAFDRGVHTYQGLWTSHHFDYTSGWLAASRAGAVANPGLLQTAKDHLAEAIYCRKFDLLSFAAAARSADAFDIARQSYTPSRQAAANVLAKLAPDRKYWENEAQRAIYFGLTIDSADRIGAAVFDALVQLLEPDPGLQTFGILVVGCRVSCTAVRFKPPVFQADLTIAEAEHLVPLKDAKSGKTVPAFDSLRDRTILRT
jgi:hypothetical protein